MITEILPNSIAHADYNDTEQPIAPGMKYKHYSHPHHLQLLQILRAKLEMTVKIGLL